MRLAIERRPSDSPHVTEIWRSASDEAGSFVSIAATHWEMVVTTRDGRSTLTVQGPETTATPLAYEPGAEWVGVSFEVGTCLSILPACLLVDRGVNLPDAGRRSFWLDGSAWEIPAFDNADVFVDRLVRAGLLARVAAVEDAVLGRPTGLSTRSVQRQFLRTTGITLSTYRQIERARHALELLQAGRSILDVVHEAGFYDQPHLTRSLRRWLGQTPAQIAASR